MMGHGTMAFASTATTTTTNGLPDLEVGEHTPLLPKPPQQDALVVLHDGKDDSHKETIVASVAAVSCKSTHRHSRQRRTGDNVVNYCSFADSFPSLVSSTTAVSSLSCSYYCSCHVALDIIVGRC